MPLVTVDSIDDLIDAAAIVMKTTRPTPIMSAAAVAECASGCASRSRRASDPVMPRSFAIGVPITSATGRANSGPRIATPMKITTAPTPTIASVLPPPRSPSTNATIPSAVTIEPITMRRSDRPDVSIEMSRIAATGGTREALIAGATAATTVNPRPTANPTATVRGFSTIPPAGMSKLSTPSNALRPSASTTPPTTPTRDAIRPTTTASKSTELST